MASEDLCFVPARELARRIATRQLSPVELVTAVIARAEKIHAACNIFAFPLYEQALAAARAAESAVIRGDALGPLHGVPLTVKDNLATVGQPMTNGSFAAMDFRPTVDAIVWQRLRDAGAILVGKTTTPEFAHKVLTDSLPFGVTRSPWSLDHTPGGSSGGAAAAVAAGVGPLAVGTDGGGSIRCPASCSGLFGIKATLGRVPFEAIPDTFANYAFTGPMTRDVRDAALMLAAMSGPTPADVHTLGVPAFAPAMAEGTSLAGLRIGWIADFGGVATGAEVGASTRQSMRLLEAAGAIVEPLDVPEFADVFEYYVVIATTAHAARLGRTADQLGERMTASLRASVEQGRGYSAAQWQLASDRRTALFRRVQSLFERFDLIATPTLSEPPWRVDAGGAINTPGYAHWCRSLYPFNLTGHPAASVPSGVSSAGLPIGLQLIGRYFDEASIFRAAAALEAAAPWADRRPMT